MKFWVILVQSTREAWLKAPLKIGRLRILCRWKKKQKFDGHLTSNVRRAENVTAMFIWTVRIPEEGRKNIFDSYWKVGTLQSPCLAQINRKSGYQREHAKNKTSTLLSTSM